VLIQELLAADDLHGRGHVLQSFGALFGRNHDFLQDVIRFARAGSRRPLRIRGALRPSQHRPAEHHKR
jgi:hypothetical protein